MGPIAEALLLFRIRRAFKHGDVTVDKLIGAVKSKTVWFGIAQLVWAAVQTYMGGGALTPEAISTLVTGIGTIFFRAITTESLQVKGATSPSSGA